MVDYSDLERWEAARDHYERHPSRVVRALWRAWCAISETANELRGDDAADVQRLADRAHEELERAELDFELEAK
jgi:hypothetical protein